MRFSRGTLVLCISYLTSVPLVTGTGDPVIEASKWAFDDAGIASTLIKAAADEVSRQGISLDSVKEGLVEVADIASSNLPDLAVKVAQRLSESTAKVAEPAAGAALPVVTPALVVEKEPALHTMTALEIPPLALVGMGGSASHSASNQNTACELDCNGNGVCTSVGTCKCNTGWGGSSCDIPRCEDDCSGNGLCLKGECVCNDGWYGASCSNKRCPNDCSGAGFCFDGKCQCMMGFEGANCSQLHVTEQTLAVKLRADKAAEPRPGLNRFLQVASLRPLQGPRCPDDCNGRGSCSAAGRCRCNVGYSGEACQTFCPNECSRQGQCIEGGCLCFAGFTGVDCSVTSCCSGHGSCDTPDTCVCDVGWGGSECSQRLVCDDPTCSGNGECVQGICECKPGFRGPSCAVAVAECEQCSENGVCNPATRTCECKPGFTGVDCTVKLLTCKKNCNARGLCLNGHCMCGTGWTGEDCSRRNFALDSAADFPLSGADFDLGAGVDPIAALDKELGPEPRIGLDMRPVEEPAGAPAKA